MLFLAVPDSFFEKKIYFHKTNLQKIHTYNTKHTIYKRKEIKAKKRLEILKEGSKKKWGGGGVAIMSFIQSIDIIVLIVSYNCRSNFYNIFCNIEYNSENKVFFNSKLIILLWTRVYQSVTVCEHGKQQILLFC